MANANAVIMTNIKRSMWHKRISKVELARLSGISTNTFWKVENGADVKLSTLEKWAGALNVRLSTLTTGT